MSTCAVCQLSDGLVINIIVASPDELPPDNCALVETPTESGSYAGIGFYWNGIEFVNPNPPTPEE